MITGKIVHVKGGKDHWLSIGMLVPLLNSQPTDNNNNNNNNNNTCHTEEQPSHTEAAVPSQDLRVC